jgi:hypothetical protein
MKKWNESQLVWKLKKLFTFFVMVAFVVYFIWLPLSPGEEALALALVAGAWMLSYKLTP